LKIENDCLPIDLLGQYLHGNLPNAQVEQLEEHLQDARLVLDSLTREAAKTAFYRAASTCKDYTDELSAAAVQAARCWSGESLATGEYPSAR